MMVDRCNNRKFCEKIELHRDNYLMFFIYNFFYFNQQYGEFDTMNLLDMKMESSRILKLWNH